MLRDDIIEYSPDNVHDEEAGKKIRKKILTVTLILSVITIVEVLVGIKFNRINSAGGLWTSIKVGYILLTLVKAGYIVMSFMHLGDERKNVRNVILIPYFVFIVYLLFICITESNYIHDVFVSLGYLE